MQKIATTTRAPSPIIAFRVDPLRRKLIEQAAKRSRRTLSKYVLDAAYEQAARDVAKG